MRSIQVTNWSEGPQVTEAEKPPAPSPSQIQLRMQVVGLHAVVRSRASGTHYSASTLPHTIGIDGVGLDESTGTSYFVIGMASNFGTGAEYVNVEKRAAVPLPQGADAAAIAAGVNPGMSSWMALTTRTTNLPKDFTVLILGATSASGELAVPLAKALGAGRIIGVARNVAALAEVAGLDRRIELKGDGGSESDFSGLDDVDVVLDYVNGDPALNLLKSIPAKKPVQYVQIGALSGSMEISLPTALLRSKNLTIRGSGPGAWSLPELGQQLPSLVKVLANLPLKQPQKFPIEQFEKVWSNKSLGKKGRVVLTL